MTKNFVLTLGVFYWILWLARIKFENLLLHYLIWFDRFSFWYPYLLCDSQENRSCFKTINFTFFFLYFFLSVLNCGVSSVIVCWFQNIFLSFFLELWCQFCYSLLVPEYLSFFLSSLLSQNNIWLHLLYYSFVILLKILFYQKLAESVQRSVGLVSWFVESTIVLESVTYSPKDSDSESKYSDLMFLLLQNAAFSREFSSFS